MTDSGSPILAAIKGVATARQASSVIDCPKSAASISCSVGVDEQPMRPAAITGIIIFFMATLSGVRFPNNNRPKRISQQVLGSKPLGGTMMKSGLSQTICSERPA